MTSNRDLFGDEDSDDDDEKMNEDVVMMEDTTTDIVAAIAAAAVVPIVTATTETIGNNNSIDSKEEEEEEEKEGVVGDEDEEMIQKSKTSQPMDTNQSKDDINDDDDDDDDDDDAPQFDDQNVIGMKSSFHNQGSSSITAATTNHATTTPNATTPKDIPIHPTLVIPDMMTRHFSSNVQHVETTKYFTKLPNIIGIQSMAFDTETYTPEIETELYQQAAYNLIRWRYKRDPVTKQLMRHIATNQKHDESKEEFDIDTDNTDEGTLVRESNTRLVEWEDGSHTLHVGTECFHIDFVDSSSKTTTTTNNNNTTTTSTTRPVECTSNDINTSVVTKDSTGRT